MKNRTLDEKGLHTNQDSFDEIRSLRASLAFIPCFFESTANPATGEFAIALWKYQRVAQRLIMRSTSFVKSALKARRASMNDVAKTIA